MNKTLRAILAVCAVAAVSFALVLFSFERPLPEPQLPDPAPAEPATPAGPATPAEPAAVDVPQEVIKPYYVLIIGNDTRYGTVHTGDLTEDSPSYSDTMMLMRIDQANNYIALCSIPRDTAITIDGREGKMNDYHLEYGPEGVCAAVGELFGVEVPYYFDMTFATFAQFIDELGGVDVEVPMDMKPGEVMNGGSLYLYAGEQHLNGVEALAFVHARKLYPDLGEACRQQNARQLVCRTIARVAADDPANAGLYAQLLGSLSKTNMPPELLEAEVRAFMEHGGEIYFNAGTGPYRGDIDSTGMWRTPLDRETYAQLSKAIQEGTPLTDIVPNPM